MPQRSSLYNYRLYVDYCSMLYARDHVFPTGPSADIEWCTHFRLDSSPQFGRNYLVGELDRISVKHARPDKLDTVSLVFSGSFAGCAAKVLYLPI